MNTPTTPASLLHQIAQIQTMEPGKLCVMRQGPDGPYYNHQTWHQGRNHSRYIPAAEIPALQQAIAGYQQFERLTQQYAQLIIDKSRAERAQGLKKKTPRLSSSWPKTRRSRS